MTNVLEQHELNTPQMHQNLTAAINGINATSRELSIVKINDFSRRDDEDSYE